MPFFSKEPKSRLRHHLKHLFLFFFLSISLLLLVIILNYRELIYPELHRNTPSPKKDIENLPLNLKPEVIEHGPRDKKQIALTFDADMTPGMIFLLQKGLVKSWYNKSIIDTLNKENTKATIFLTGLWVKTYPSEAKSLASNPQVEIGNHSYDHPAFTKNCFRLSFIDNDKDKDEVLTAQQEIQKTTGVTPKYFRFPGGCYEKIDVETISKLGLKIIHWDVVAGDGFNQNTDSIITRVLSTAQNGSIVVFHLQGGPYAPKTNDALQKIIPELRRRGYQFVTISEMLSS